jgi:hypothetical protein
MRRTITNSTSSRIRRDTNALLTRCIGNGIHIVWLALETVVAVVNPCTGKFPPKNASEECKPVPLQCNKESGAERAMSMQTRRWKRG